MSAGAGDVKSGRWEQRWHPLRQEWIVVAAHRQDRPWIGHTVEGLGPVPAYDPDCYLCPGNTRISGKQNPKYEDTFVFDNDHPCVGRSAPRTISHAHPPYRAAPASGFARVVCYNPRHDLALSRLPVDAVDLLMACWQEQYRELSRNDDIACVLTFENRGEATGVSNPHPHCQIYATNFVFRHIATEADASRAHLESSGEPLFQSILRAELESGTRIVFENDAAVVFVPWFARYAYEGWVAPRRTHRSIADVPDDERYLLAEAASQLVRRYDNLWNTPFPYVMTLHQAPTDGSPTDGFHFFMEFQPPLRKPGLLKHLAGPEIGGGNFISDTFPDEKAEELRGVRGDRHYADAR